jgi:ABC-type bacteriocin/lantibiotic exporter with double-glycine peptidase domain
MIVDNRTRGIDLRLVIFFLLLRSLIPFVPQEGEGANKYINDCGPAIVSMLIKHYTGVLKTPDWLMDQIGYDRYTTTYDLEVLAEPWGIEMEEWELSSIDDVIDNAPAIVVVDLWTLHGDKWGRHWILVTGEVNGMVRFHDPLYGPDILKGKETVESARSRTAWPSLVMVVTETKKAEQFKRVLETME